MIREHILQEIKRTAEANHGVPLGWRKFAEETGIRDRDWLGKHWARWGEAVREAGYTPNQMTQALSSSVHAEHVRLAYTREGSLLALLLQTPCFQDCLCGAENPRGGLIGNFLLALQPMLNVAACGFCTGQPE